jgi:hypothetical protein
MHTRVGLWMIVQPTVPHPPTDFKTLNKNSTKHNRVFQKHGPNKKFVINLRYPPPKYSTSVHATYAILRELKTWETSIDAQSFSNSFEGVHGVVRKSGRGSSIFVFYCIFMLQFFKVFWGGTWGAPPRPPRVHLWRQVRSVRMEFHNLDPSRGNVFLQSNC